MPPPHPVEVGANRRRGIRRGEGRDVAPGHVSIVETDGVLALDDEGASDGRLRDDTCAERTHAGNVRDVVVEGDVHPLHVRAVGADGGDTVGRLHRCHRLPLNPGKHRVTGSAPLDDEGRQSQAIVPGGARIASMRAEP